jgi:hypothetical protein
MKLKEMKIGQAMSVTADDDNSDYNFFEMLEKVSNHPVDAETKDIMKDVVRDKNTLFKKLDTMIKKLRS